MSKPIPKCPRLGYSPLTGSWFIVTSQTPRGVAIKKFDVTAIVEGVISTEVRARVRALREKLDAAFDEVGGE